MKKEVSEHLARAFFDNKKERKKGRKIGFYSVLTLCLVGSFVFGVFFYAKGMNLPLQALGLNFALEKHDGPYALNFDFSGSPTKVQSLNIELANADIAFYDVLRFSVRLASADTRQPSSIKVGIVNNRKETSSLYITGLGNSWKKVTIPFSSFAQISDWSCLTQLTFALEEWNLSSKKGQLLIDNVEFSKKRRGLWKS